MTKCMIIWYYWVSDKVVNSSATLFEGTEDKLQKRIKEEYDKNNKSGGVGTDDNPIVTCHNIVILP